MDTTINFNPDLLQKYDVAGPRYTSYPTAVQFDERFAESHYRQQALASHTKPLSLYLHLPFCATVCYYCACNKIITANRKRATPYLALLHQEIALQAKLFGHDRVVKQLHWGGGTPTFISAAQMRDLMHSTAEHFQLLTDDSGEYSIEVDPREADAETIGLLRSLGFNRLSLGVQDFDPQVQQAVNRLQSEQVTAQVVTAARQQGFKSINIDLIYGLPRQSVASFDRTLDAIIALDPDRLSIFNYAHLPALFKVQRQIDSSELPSANVKLAILQHVIQRLATAGYVYIGMDHFAKPEDELACAQQQGTLYRNFQGYSTHADCDLVAMGMTAIGKVGNSYSQNAKTMDAYMAALESGYFPVYRGIALSEDDCLRRAVINQLICHFSLDFAAIENHYQISFADYFTDELRQLEELEKDDLLHRHEDGIVVLPAGRLLIRNICMVFDRYLRQRQAHRFSKAI